MAQPPKIEFSNWFSWNERCQIHGCELPGVYALAHFDRRPRGLADPLVCNVRYIGQSCGREGVIGRLGLFDRSARTGKNGHSGGKTYHAQYGSISDDLCVAAFLVDDLSPAFIKTAYILFVERELIWKFSIAHKNLPQCNKC